MQTAAGSARTHGQRHTQSHVGGSSSLFIIPGIKKWCEAAGCWACVRVRQEETESGSAGIIWEALLFPPGASQRTHS